MARPKERPLAAGYRYEADTIGEPLWGRLLLEFDDSNLSQTWAYAAAEEGAHNVSPLKLTLNGETVAIALARFRRLPILGVGLAYVHNGPVWRRNGAAVNDEHFRQILRALCNEFVCKRGLTLRLNPALTNDDAQLNGIVADEGFLPAPGQEQHRTILMDLTPPLETLRQGMDRNWKRNLKQDEERNLEVIRGSDESMLEELIGVYKEMVSRKTFAASDSVNEFKRLQTMLPDELKLKIMLCKHEGSICAGLAWSALGDTGIELIAATSNKGTQSGGAHLLRWKLVEELKQQGALTYNLNGINPEKNPGTYRFKKGLVGKNGREVSYMGKLDASAGPLSATLIRFRDKMKKLRSH